MDHRKVDIHTTNMSCGVKQISRIDDDIESALYAIASDLYHPSRGNACAFIVMSDIATEKTATSLLTQFVKDASLGEIVASPVSENPKTGNIIKVYIWTIIHEQFKKWYSEKRIERLKKAGA